MFTYQIRRRVLRVDGNAGLQFPNVCRIRFHFLPLQPFGEQPGGGRSTVRAKPARAVFNANTGEHTIECDDPLSPLNVVIDEPDCKLRLEGATMTIEQRCETPAALGSAINSVYFAMPALLAIDYGDPPFVARVEGEVGTVPFRWELQEWGGRFWTTTQALQEQAFATAWDRMVILGKSENRRLLAGLHYFHVALRLQRTGAVAGEFLAEMLLNLSKVLEVLFPPRAAGTGTREAVRAQLLKLRFSPEEIERDYLPAMALRNEIDVGHVGLAIFTVDELALIHGYVSNAERSFRELFTRVFSQVEAGTLEIAPYDLKSAKTSATPVLRRLKQFRSHYVAE